MLNLSFDQLFDETKFRSLKKKFLKRDMQYTVLTSEYDIDESAESISFYKEIVVKTYEATDPFGFPILEYDTEFEFCELNFYSDYLYPAIKSMVNQYKIKFENHLINKNIWGDTERDNFSNFQMTRIDALKKGVELKEHLTENVKSRIQDALSEIYMFVSSKYYKPNDTNNKKIRINGSRIDVVLFFELLIRNGLIASTSLELSDFITRNFMYYDKSQNIFKEITGTKGLVRKIRAGDSLDKSLKHLQAIFKSNNFYNCV